MYMGLVYFIETTKNEKDRLIFSISEYLFSKNFYLQIICSTVDRARKLDTFLWTFSPSSFVGHKILHQASEETFLNEVVICPSEFEVDHYNNIMFDKKFNFSLLRNKIRSFTFIIKDDPAKLEETRAIWKEASKRGLSTQHVPYSQGLNFFYHL